jgi:hypothetical protein
MSISISISQFASTPEAKDEAILSLMNDQNSTDKKKYKAIQDMYDVEFAEDDTITTIASFDDFKNLYNEVQQNSAPHISDPDLEAIYTTIKAPDDNKKDNDKNAPYLINSNGLVLQSVDNDTIKAKLEAHNVASSHLNTIESMLNHVRDKDVIVGAETPYFLADHFNFDYLALEDAIKAVPKSKDIFNALVEHNILDPYGQLLVTPNQAKTIITEPDFLTEAISNLDEGLSSEEKNNIKSALPNEILRSLSANKAVVYATLSHTLLIRTKKQEEALTKKRKETQKKEAAELEKEEQKAAQRARKSYLETMAISNAQARKKALINAQRNRA